MILIGGFEEEVANYWEEEDRRYAVSEYTKVLERRNRAMVERRRLSDAFQRIHDGVSQVSTAQQDQDLATSKRG